MFKLHPIYQDREGEDNGGAGGQTPEEIAAAATAASNARFEALEKAVGLMAQGHGQLNETLTSLTAKLDTIGDGGGRGTGTGTGTGSGGGDDEVDLETLDRKGFAMHILKNVKGVVEEAVKPLGERFSTLDEKIDGQSLSIMIKDFQKDHPDFFEWKEEMRGLLKESPTLTPARAYSLARSESPEKARKIDEKYKMNKQASGKPNGQDTFLSLFPQGGSATKGGPGKMNPKQAAEAAWDQVMSSLGSG